MQQLLKSAAIAWNPVREIERRRREGGGSLSIWKVLVPFTAVAIGCALANIQAQGFVLKSAAYGYKAELPPNPPLVEGFATQFLAVLGVLLPLAGVAALPRKMFEPAAKREVLAAVVILYASWMFYGAVLIAVLCFFASIPVSKGAEPGVVFFVFAVSGLLGMIGMILLFCIRALGGVLELPGGSIVAVLGAALGATILGALALVAVAL